MKFINLFPEIKHQIQVVYRNEANIKNADVEIQQRTVEYLKLSQIAGADVLATVLEEMPPFIERESSILSNILQKKKPLVDATTGNAITPDQQQQQENKPVRSTPQQPTMSINSNVVSSSSSIPASQSIDLLGIDQISPITSNNNIHDIVHQAPKSNQDALLDIFGDTLTTQQPVTNGNSFDSIFSTQPYENGGGHSIIETIKDNHLQYV